MFWKQGAYLFTEAEGAQNQRFIHSFPLGRVNELLTQSSVLSRQHRGFHCSRALRYIGVAVLKQSLATTKICIHAFEIRRLREVWIQILHANVEKTSMHLALCPVLFWQLRSNSFGWRGWAQAFGWHGVLVVFHQHGVLLVSLHSVRRCVPL